MAKKYLITEPTLADLQRRDRVVTPRGFGDPSIDRLLAPGELLVRPKLEETIPRGTILAYHALLNDDDVNIIFNANRFEGRIPTENDINRICVTSEECQPGQAVVAVYSGFATVRLSDGINALEAEEVKPDLGVGLDLENDPEKYAIISDANRFGTIVGVGSEDAEEVEGLRYAKVRLGSPPETDLIVQFDGGRSLSDEFKQPYTLPHDKSITKTAFGEFFYSLNDAHFVLDPGKYLIEFVVEMSIGGPGYNFSPQIHTGKLRTGSLVGYGLVRQFPPRSVLHRINLEGSDWPEVPFLDFIDTSPAFEQSEVDQSIGQQFEYPRLSTESTYYLPVRTYRNAIVESDDEGNPLEVRITSREITIDNDSSATGGIVKIRRLNSKVTDTQTMVDFDPDDFDANDFF